MYTCTLCQRNFKMYQGLAGHNFFVHSNRSVAMVLRVYYVRVSYDSNTSVKKD